MVAQWSKAEFPLVVLHVAVDALCVHGICKYHAHRVYRATCKTASENSALVKCASHERVPEDPLSSI